jgi:NADH:ubiquinone oxidoreductase subunit 6 (subunit J)
MVYSTLAVFAFLSIRLFLGPTVINSGQSNTIFSFIPTLESISNVGYGFYIIYTDVLILNSLILTIALFGALVLAHKSN